MNHVIGIDVSTTATKAILIDETGSVIGSGAATYGFESPQPLWAEQDPVLWWEGTKAAIRRMMATTSADPASIAGIGLTGQMHGLVLLDQAGVVLRPAILWNDQRTATECAEIRRRIGRERLIEITGNDALPGFTAPKLLWVARHEPDVWAHAHTFLLPKDYVRYRLTGELAIDAADGSGTALFDLAERTWSGEVLGLLDLPTTLFPAIFEGPQVTGALTESAADATGLAAGTPVVAGGGDQAANAVGVGAVIAGRVALSLGTSGVVFATTDGPVIESAGRLHSFCHAVPGRWHMMGVMLSAAGSLRWIRDIIAPDLSFESLIQRAEETPAGSDGLLFLPYLSGERTPYADPRARGAFVGLTVRHHLGHLIRAVMEGVAFGLRDCLDLMTASGMAEPEQIRGSGGGTRSSLWRQILADVLGAEIVVTTTEEGAAFGAGILAAVGAGWFDSVDNTCDAFVRIGPPTVPSPDADIYGDAHLRYRDLYPALKATFDATP